MAKFEAFVNRNFGISAPVASLLIAGLAALAPSPALASKKVELTKLFCLDTQEAGEDEVYIDVVVDGVPSRIPASGAQDMNEDSEIDTWTLNKTIEFKSSISITITEDDASYDEKIGSVSLDQSTANGLHQTSWLDNGQYTLYYEVYDGGGAALARAPAVSAPAKNVIAQINSVNDGYVKYGIYGGFSSSASTHIQGMAVADGFWILTHDVTGHRRGELVVIDAEKRYHLNTYAFDLDSDGYPSGAQGDGDIVAVATGSDKKIRIFQIQPGGRFSELTNLKIDVGGLAEDVGLVFHHGHKRHYILTANSASTKMWVSDDATLDASSIWSEVSVIGTVPFGEAGLSLIYEEPSMKLYALSLGNDGASTDSSQGFAITELKQTGGSMPESAYTAMSANTSHFTLNNEPHFAESHGFRWGGTAHVRSDGRLQLIAAPRDFKLIGSSDFGVWTASQSSAAASGQTTVASAPPKLEFTIVSVKCVETTEVGEDEIYLAVSDGTRIPAGDTSYYDIDDGQTWSVDRTIAAMSDLVITLMEYDSTDDRDLIGRIPVLVSQSGGNQTIKTQLSGDGGVYQVTYRIK